jgi:hypothetical protein|tara:strand:+ start:484 stop:900 length:417 start_codon:yes stop_codon:yes gene_type:complete
MIASFDNIYLFLICLVGCVITPGFYSYKLWEAKSLFKRYNVDDSATQFTRFAATWPMAESITAILILYYGPEGNWAFFILGLIVFTANLFYNSLSYFNIAFTLGRDKYKVSPEAVIASIFKVSVYLILIIGLKGKIFL